MYTEQKDINIPVPITDPLSTVSDIVRSDYRTADVFRRHNINYCCAGHITVKDACDSLKLNYDDIREELEKATLNIQLPNTLQFNEWKLDFLVDYIINVHHAYLFQAIPELDSALDSFMSSHLKQFPYLSKIHQIFHELIEILVRHNRHEEAVIFSYIKQLDRAYSRKESYGSLFVRTLRKPLDNIESEHKKIGELLLRLRAATNNYTFPANACTNHQVLFRKLQEFHNDLVQHKHLENNILFPKAREIEQELLLN